MTCSAHELIAPLAAAPEETVYIRHCINRARVNGDIVNTALRSHAADLADDNAHALAVIVEQARQNWQDMRGYSIGPVNALQRYEQRADIGETYALDEDGTALLSGVPVFAALDAYATRFERQCDGHGQYTVTVERTP